MGEYGIFTEVIKNNKERDEKRLTKERINTIFYNKISEHEKNLVEVFKTLGNIKETRKENDLISIHFDVESDNIFLGIQLNAYNDDFSLTLHRGYGDEVGKILDSMDVSYRDMNKENFEDLIEEYLKDLVRIALKQFE